MLIESGFNVSFGHFPALLVKATVVTRQLACYPCDHPIPTLQGGRTSLMYCDAKPRQITTQYNGQSWLLE